VGDLILWLVIGIRFLIPLAIPRFPLPAIVLALVVDAPDQSVFAAFDAEPANYQGYDKALDVFYLNVAYISTIRNWTDGVAFRVGQFLWYYRLAGVVAFELSDARALLVLFPNTFEYFFIAYEAVRVRWEPSRLSRRQTIGAAVGLWVAVKLPQETWIHVWELDVTDVLGERPWLVPLLLGVLAAATAALWGWRDRLPAADWPAAFDVDAHPTTVVGELADPPSSARALINHPLVEKTLLVALVSIVFAQILPGVQATQLAVAVAVVVAVNSAVSQWLIRRGTQWANAIAEFSAMAVVNAGIVSVYALLRRIDGVPNVINLAFFIGLLTLIVTLYDRYRYLRLPEGRPAVILPADAANRRHWVGNAQRRARERPATGQGPESSPSPP
jgi:hypothetical protein